MTPFQRNLFLTIHCIVPALAISVFACMSLGYFAYALACTISIVLMMETRVQLAGRLPRGPIFWLHVSSAFLFLITLVSLSFAPTSPPAVISAWLLAVVMFTTGTMLWYRGLRKFLYPHAA